MRASGQTLEEIGRIVNLTRERVRQLLARESAPPPLERCPSCGSIVSRRGYTAPRTCTRCRQTKLCRLCDHTFLSTTPNAAYCNACRFATQACESCGAPITRDRGRQADRFRNKKWFCDKRCQGRWMAVHHGSGTPAGRERTIKNIGRLQTAHRAWLNKIAASASFTPSRMQDLRHSLQMTRSALAAELGVKPTSIYLWESGRRRPALQTAMLAFNEMYECRDALRAAEVRC
jgi:DNA-binding XRE family transcriptional regulator